MTNFAFEMRRCRRVVILHAVLDAGGNQCAAAKVLGVHRNTVSREMHAGGYTPKQLKRMAAARGHEREYARKPVMSETAPAAERRRA